MDLSTSYLGLELPHPFVVGASPFADSLDDARRVEDAGAAAIVMRSLFEEQIHAEALATTESFEEPAESFGEALSYFPDPDEFVLGPEEYLERVRRMKEAVAMPVIASLNGVTPGGWLHHAVLVQQAGADALELNLYDVPMEPAESADTIEERTTEMVRSVRQAIDIPLAVKLSPFYTSLPNFAMALESAGAGALVLFNRFFEPDVDPEELEVRPHLELSGPAELLLRLRWLAILSGHLEKTELAVTGGVHGALDAVRAVLCGASCVQMVSALLHRGPEHLAVVRRAMAQWMEEQGYNTIAEMRGAMNIRRCPDPQAYARGNYMRTLQTWSPNHTSGLD